MKNLNIKNEIKQFLKKPIFYIVKILTKPLKLKNIIIITAHGDFDCNGGAIYNYLIKNNYNKKYKIIWFLNNEVPTELPFNVEAYKIHVKNIRKYLLICSAKFFFADDYVIQKVRDDQISVYCTHGAFGLKDARKWIDLKKDNVDYVLSLSKNMDDYMIYSHSIDKTNTKLLHLGFPFIDIFYENTEDEYEKIFHENYLNYNKKILWMPTFRKGEDNRNDSEEDFPLGIPLFKDFDDLKKLNNILKKENILLTIKIHPSQDPDSLKNLHSLSNILVIKPSDERKYNLNKYNLMKYTDALISDYSGAAYEYLLLNRPLAFVINDIHTYTAGFIVENIFDYMPGNLINSIDDFIIFIDDIIKCNDRHILERTNLLKQLYNYNDGNNTKRLLKYLNI